MPNRKETVRRALEALHDLEDEMDDPDTWNEPVDRTEAIERVKELQRKLSEERDNLPHGL